MNEQERAEHIGDLKQSVVCTSNSERLETLKGLKMKNPACRPGFSQLTQCHY